MPETTLQELIDRDAIVDVMSRYARGIDRRDAAVYRSCFTDVIDVDMGGPVREGVAADDWVEQALTLVSAYTSTQHIISNHVVDIDGDTAVCRAEVQAQHWNPDGRWLLGGRYTDGFVRTPEGWRIRRLGLAVGWTETTGEGQRPGQRP